MDKVKLPSGVETIGFLAFSKTDDSNENLTTIVNLSGKEFDWSNITYSTTPDQSFVTGTITHQNGNITVTDK